MDRAWWREHLSEVRKTFSGELACPLNNCFDVPQVKTHRSQNSGAGAVALAHHWGAERIILLGYDLMAIGGKKHWHGDHPKGLGNAGSMPKWPAQFRRVAEAIGPGVEVINCTRQTVLKCWPRASLEETLCVQ